MINTQDPFVFGYTIKKKDAQGYCPGGFVSGHTKTEAIWKLCDHYQITEELATLDFMMTMNQWEIDRAQTYQGD